MVYRRESEESECSNWRTGSTTRRIDIYIPDRAMVPTPASPPGSEDPTERKPINYNVVFPTDSISNRVHMYLMNY